MILQDSTGGLIPLVKDSLGGVKEPIWLVSEKRSRLRNMLISQIHN